MTGMTSTEQKRDAAEMAGELLRTLGEPIMNKSVVELLRETGMAMKVFRVDGKIYVLQTKLTDRTEGYQTFIAGFGNV